MQTTMPTLKRSYYKNSPRLTSLLSSLPLPCNNLKITAANLFLCRRPFLCDLTPTTAGTPSFASLATVGRERAAVTIRHHTFVGQFAATDKFFSKVAAV